VKLEVRRLEATDDRTTFRSGNVDLDRFFLRYAGQNQFRHHIGTSYVALDLDGTIVGYATVSASEIAPEGLNPAERKRVARYPIPVLRLARLAVDERATGRGVGTTLLRSVLLIAQQMARDVGCVGVVIDAKSDAVAFYERLGFVKLDIVSGELGDRPPTTAMFVELGQIPRSR
jgi:GNAT superfamily N-acetyltransferase